jgi:predicted metal-binding protein
MRLPVSAGVDVPLDNRPHLYICVSCKCHSADAVPEGEPTDGRRLYEVVKALAHQMGESAPAQVLPMLCFANCDRGCSAGITAAGKWSYLVGELGPEHAADLLTYAQAYAKAKTGVVLPSGRPASLETNVIARFPASFEPTKDAAE